MGRLLRVRQITDASRKIVIHVTENEFNPDQGSRFTSWAWTQRLKEAGVRISMDGRGRFLDNIFIERLWRSLKYGCACLHALSAGPDRTGPGQSLNYPRTCPTGGE